MKILINYFLIKIIAIYYYLNKQKLSMEPTSSISHIRFFYIIKFLMILPYLLKVYNIRIMMSVL